MKKMTVFGIIIAVYFIAIPSLVFAKQCTTVPDPGGTPAICADSILSFKAINYESAADKAIVEAQIFVEIINPTTGGDVRFHFFNVGANPATITSIIFAENAPLVFDYANYAIDPGSQGLDSAGNPNVAFAVDSNPAHINLIPDERIAFTAIPPPSHTGVDPGEYLDIIMNFEGSNGYEDLIASLADGSLSLGLHVQSIGTNGESAKMTLLACVIPGGGDTPVPEPASMLLLGTGLVGIAGTVRRRKKRC